jgi:hypothetical protein
MTKEQRKKISDYGMSVSAIHDPRYFNIKHAEEMKATPKTCPPEIKEILIAKYGDNWVDEFWGESYYVDFPETK